MNGFIAHERDQNALMQVKGPSLKNEYSDSGFTKMSDEVSAITARHPLKSPVVRRRATWAHGGLVSSLNDVALLLKVFFAVDLPARVTLFKELKTSGTPLATRKRL